MNMKKRRVGIVCVHANPFHETIIVPLQREIRLLGPTYTPVLITVKRTEEDFIKQISYINANARCDLFVLIGMSITETFCRLYLDRAGIPCLFVAIPTPGKLTFLKPFLRSLEKPGGLISGVTSEGNPARYAQDIIKFYPRISRIVLPYYPDGLAGIVGKNALAITEQLRNAGMTIYAKPISTTHEAAAEIDAHMNDVDGILFMEGCPANDIAEETAIAAWKNRKIFFSSYGLVGIGVGATVSFGADDAIYAAPLAEKIRLYFEEHIPIGGQPVTILPDMRHCMVNEAMFCQIRYVDDLLDKLHKDASIEFFHEWPTKFNPRVGVDDSMCYDPSTGRWYEKEESSDGQP